MKPNMILELLLARILIKKEINSADKDIKNRISIIHEKIKNDLLMSENQKLPAKLKQEKEVQ